MYKLIIEYDGSNFYGFQKQPELRTVAGVIEEQLEILLKLKIKLIYASRTDKGVSAYNQVANINVDLIENIFKFRYALNSLLPSDVKVKKIEKVSDTFSANKNIKYKVYRYNLFASDYHYPLQSKNCAYIYQSSKLNISLMKKACKFLIGEHDFSAFCSADCEKEIKVRMLYKIKIKKVQDVYTFEFIGNGFLQHMIRIIIGTLIDVGSKKIEPKKIQMILNSKNRLLASYTAPANGLYLVKVCYK